MQALGTYADDLEAKQKTISMLMARMQLGERLAPDEETLLCSDMREANNMWLAANMRMRYSDDFQAVEFFKVCEARLLRDEITMDALEGLMRWQPESMEATMRRTRPPPLPPSVDPAKLQQVAEKASIMETLASSPSVTAPVFARDSSVFDSPLVKEEYEALMRDHEQLIRFGSGYRSFDPLGKEAFLDQLAMVGDRWKIFFGRAQLMGSLNPAYIGECDDYLRRAGFSVDEFNCLLEEAHGLMRADAAREGLQR